MFCHFCLKHVGFDLWSLGMSFKKLWEHDESILSKLMGLRIQFQSNSDSSCEKRVKNVFCLNNFSVMLMFQSIFWGNHFQHVFCQFLYIQMFAILLMPEIPFPTTWDGMVLKPCLNNGISTTNRTISTGELIPDFRDPSTVSPHPGAPPGKTPDADHRRREKR